MTGAQAQLVQGHLLWLATTVAADAFRRDVLGPLLGPQSGGLIVRRSLQAWKEGRAAA